MKKINIIFLSAFMLIGSVLAKEVTNNVTINTVNDEMIIFQKNVSPNQMVNIAGKQRMLSQKIAKIYLMQAYGANLQSLKTELNTSRIIFDRNIETLERNSAKMFSNKVTKAISKEKASWANLRAIITNPTNENNVNKVIEVSNKLLKLSNDVVVAIKAENFDSNRFSTNVELLNTIDKSGKQRMLSQRLCLFFIAKKFNLKNQDNNYRINNILDKTYNELDNSLVDLLNSELNTLDVEEAIGNALLSFENLRSQKSNFLSGKASLNIVYKTTNKLTKEFDYLTSKYSALKTKNNTALTNR